MEWSSLVTKTPRELCVGTPVHEQDQWSIVPCAQLYRSQAQSNFHASLLFSHSDGYTVRASSPFRNAIYLIYLICVYVCNTDWFIGVWFYKQKMLSHCCHISINAICEAIRRMTICKFSLYFFLNVKNILWVCVEIKGQHCHLTMNLLSYNW